MSETLTHEDQRLIVMANQIAHFFARQKSKVTPAADVAEHLTAFWTPAMRARLKVLAPLDPSTDEGEALSDIAKASAALLA